MLRALEQSMAFVRKVKLYVDIVAAVAASLAITLVAATRELMLHFAQSGGLLVQSILKEGLVMAVSMMIVFGYGVKVTFFKHRSFQLGDLFIYLLVGIASIGMAFWVIPLIANLLAVHLLTPAFKALAEFLTGDATVSIKSLLKLLFLVYLVSFAISMLYQMVVLRRNVSMAILKMLNDYRDELFEVLHDLWDISISTARAVFSHGKRPDGG